jgi:hypothetical protein
MKRNAASGAILGIMASGRGISAALVRNTEKGPEVVRYFSRQVSSPNVSAALESPNVQVDDGDTGMGSDFTIKFGGGGQGGDLFLSSEFSGMEADGADGILAANAPGAAHGFEEELRSILKECTNSGYADPLVTFCETAAFVTATELRVGEVPKPEESVPGSKKLGKKRGGSSLVAQLSAQMGTDIADGSYGFIPMTPTESGSDRYLALVRTEGGPVARTLTAMRSRRTKMPAARLLDNEIAIYLGLARTAYFLVTSDLANQDLEEATGVSKLLPGDRRKTLVVRAGLEDTLVLFMENDKLLHYESLRSITTYDAPETICSRVLLLQDEYGIGDVQHVLLLSEDREEAIVESFRMFFSDTRVESLREYIPTAMTDSGDDNVNTSFLLATGVALRLCADQLYQGSFDDINLLPKKLLRKSVSLPVTWHVMVLYATLFVSVLFFVARYFANESKANQHQQRIAEYAPEYANADPAVLKARVDSLNRVTTGYMRALQVLDSLLVGSDAWSRSLETASEEISETRGIWIDNWKPNGRILVLSGNATSRDRIVELARRTESDIESVTFSEIREWPVYTFTMRMPIPNTLPEAAKYLRDQVRILTEQHVESTGMALQ